MDEIDALVNDLPDEIVDFIADLQSSVQTLTKRAEDAEALAANVVIEDDEVDERDRLTKALEDIEDDEARAFIIEKLDELETIREQAEVEAIAKADAEYISKAREFDGLGDPDVLGPALRRVAELSPEDAEIFEKALAAAAEQTSESSLYDEIGHSLAKASDVLTEVEAISKSYREADPTLDEAAANAKVWENRPDLYDEYVSEQRNRQRL